MEEIKNDLVAYLAHKELTNSTQIAEFGSHYLKGKYGPSSIAVSFMPSEDDVTFTISTDMGLPGTVVVTLSELV